VILGAVVIHQNDTPRPAPTAPTAPTALAAAVGLPPPLPSGAPPRGMHELPTDEERDTGCHFTDRGFGDYTAWRRLALPGSALLGQVLIPAGGAVTESGSFRLLIHFHGAEPVRKQLAPEGFHLVIAGVDAGVGSAAYERAFPPGAFEQLVSAIEREVAAESRLPGAHAGPIALSSWSAGYGAVSQVLARPHPRIAAVILLDSLYAGYVAGKRTLEHGQLRPFLGAARDALRGGPLFYLTHTAIMTPDYASTEEVASFLLQELGAHAAPVEANPDDPHPLLRFYEAGHLSIRGYGGADRDAHCAQLHLLPALLRDTILPGLPP
jgi:hypothetical protein